MSPHEPAVPDTALLSRIALGDRAAFGEFYDRHCPRILGLLLRLLRDRAASDDVLQETFLQVWRSAATYDSDRAGPLVWLTLIARSRARDRMRQRRRADGMTAPLSEPLAADARIEAADAAEAAETGQRTRGALHQLPEEQRQMIRLSFFGGLSHAEIAERTALPLGTIKTRIRLGIRRLREILNGQQKASA